MATPFNYLSRDAQDALTEFSESFDGALAADEAVQWSHNFGLYEQSRAIQTTYPVPVDAAGYVERKGNDPMRDLFEKSASIKPKEWTDGVKILAYKAEAPDFIGWAGAPERIAKESRRQPNLLVAELLASNPTLEFDGKALFAADHPVNIFKSSLGSFSNLTTASAIDATMVKAVKLAFRQRKASNGRSMGLRWTHVLVPAAREEEAQDFFQSDALILALENKAGTENVAAVGTNNRHKGTVQVVVCDELTSDDDLFALDASSGAYPWILQDGGAPEEIRYDKTDALYKDSGMIGMKYVLLMGVAAMLPHAIQRIRLS